MTMHPSYRHERQGRTNSSLKKREAERRETHPRKKTAWSGPVAQYAAIQPPRGARLTKARSPFGAPPRLCAGICTPTRPGPRFLESPSANGRTLLGTSAASTSRPGVSSRTGRCLGRLQANSDELRPQEPHPLRQRRHRLTSLNAERDSALIQKPAAKSKDPWCAQICAGKSRTCADAVLAPHSANAFHSRRFAKKGASSA
jgi:hypothetical protein